MVGHFESTELPEDINEPGQHGEAGAKKKVNNISSWLMIMYWSNILFS